MTESESPGAVAALGASEIAQLGGKVFSETKRQNRFAQASIRATLSVSNSCEANDLTARGYAPVLDLCRQLLAAGYDPASPLEAWRGEILCLCIRSIGEGAWLTSVMIGMARYAFDAAREARKGVASPPVAEIADGPGVATPSQKATWEAAP
jgi:hypothetical protein